MPARYRAGPAVPRFGGGPRPRVLGLRGHPQAALMTSRPPFAITRAPGHVVVTDAPDAAYRQP